MYVRVCVYIYIYIYTCVYRNALGWILILLLLVTSGKWFTDLPSVRPKVWTTGVWRPCKASGGVFPGPRRVLEGLGWHLGEAGRPPGGGTAASRGPTASPKAGVYKGFPFIRDFPFPFGRDFPLQGMSPYLAMRPRAPEQPPGHPSGRRADVGPRPISLLRFSLLGFVDSAFPGNSLWT